MDYERAYATIIMVIGATVFGYIVGSVSALASNPNGSQARETVKILAVSNYLGEKKVQQKLRQVLACVRACVGATNATKTLIHDTAAVGVSNNSLFFSSVAMGRECGGPGSQGTSPARVLTANKKI